MCSANRTSDEEPHECREFAFKPVPPLGAVFHGSHIEDEPRTHANAVSRNTSSTTSSRFNCTLGDSHLLAAAPAITLTRAGFTVASRSHWTCAATHRHERLPGRRAHEPAHAHASQEA